MNFGQAPRNKNAKALYPPVQKPYPPLWFGGSSDEAIELAGEQVDVYLTWGKPPAAVAEKIAKARASAAKHGRTLRFGIRLHVIVRETSDAAWRAADELISYVTDDTVAAAQKAFSRFDSVGQQRMAALHVADGAAQAGGVAQSLGRRRTGSRRRGHGLGRQPARGRCAHQGIRAAGHRDLHLLGLPAPGRGLPALAELVFLLLLLEQQQRAPGQANLTGPFGEVIANDIARRPPGSQPDAVATRCPIVRSAALQWPQYFPGRFPWPARLQDRRRLRRLGATPIPHARARGAPVGGIDRMPLPAHTRLVELGEIVPKFGSVLQRSKLPPEIESILRDIESADLLLVASPIYRGSYTGLFKHLFDFVHHEALIDVPVLLAATGGSDRHRPGDRSPVAAPVQFLPGSIRCRSASMRPTRTSTTTSVTDESLRARIARWRSSARCRSCGSVALARSWCRRWHSPERPRQSRRGPPRPPCFRRPVATRHYLRH